MGDLWQKTSFRRGCGVEFGKGGLGPKRKEGRMSLMREKDDF